MTAIATLVLGLAAENPSGPYEMLKTLEKVNIKRWYPVSDPSVYLAVKKLEKEGYLAGTPVREGNNPEKTVYSVTDAGSQALRDSITSYLESSNSPREAVDIGILFLCHLPKETALEVLTRTIATLQSELTRAESLSAQMAGNSEMPFIGKLMVRHNYLEKQARITLYSELRDAVTASPRWDYFIARPVPR